MSLLRNAFFRYEKTLRACYCSEMQFLGTKNHCGHVTAQKCIFLGTKKPLRACYCSEMPFCRYKKAPAGMLLLRNAIFTFKKALAECVFPRKTTNKLRFRISGVEQFKQSSFSGRTTIDAHCSPRACISCA